MLPLLNAETKRAIEIQHRLGILDRYGNVIKALNGHKASAYSLVDEICLEVVTSKCPNP